MTETNHRKKGERVQFTCIDCGKEVDRKPVDMDIPGLTPRRCAECVVEQMGKTKGIDSADLNANDFR